MTFTVLQIYINSVEMARHIITEQPPTKEDMEYSLWEKQKRWVLKRLISLLVFGRNDRYQIRTEISNNKDIVFTVTIPRYGIIKVSKKGELFISIMEKFELMTEENVIKHGMNGLTRLFKNKTPIRIFTEYGGVRDQDDHKINNISLEHVGIESRMGFYSHQESVVFIALNFDRILFAIS